MPGGRDIYDLPLPAVVSVLEGINLPRYPSVPAKLRARSKPVESSTPERPAPKLEKLRLVVPPGQGKQAEILGDGPGGGAARRGDHARDRGGLMSVLVLVEPGEELSLQAISLARDLGNPVHALPFDAAELGPYGVLTVHVADHDRLSAYAPAAWAACLEQLIDQVQPDAVVAAGTNRGNEVLGHLAARRDLPFAANCIAVGSEGAVTRVRWGGSLLEEARIHA